MTPAQSKLRQKFFLLLLVVGSLGLSAFALVVMLADRQLFENFVPENRALRDVESRSAFLIQNYFRFMLTPDLVSTQALADELAMIRHGVARYSRLVRDQPNKRQLAADINQSIDGIEIAGREMIRSQAALARIFLSQRSIEKDIAAVFAQYRVALDRNLIDAEDRKKQALLPTLSAVDEVNHDFLQLLLTLRRYQINPSDAELVEIETLKRKILAANIVYEIFAAGADDLNRTSAQVLNVREEIIATVNAFVSERRKSEFAVSRAEQASIDLNESILMAITISDAAGWKELRDSLFLSGGVLFATLIIAYLLIYIGLDRILRPLEMLQAVISRLGEGDFKQRSKDVQRSDEIGQLAGAFNRMADQLEQNVEQQQLFIEQLEEKNMELERFTYTVSHELKSPLVTVAGFIGLLKKDLENNNKEKIDSNMSRINHAIEVMAKQLEDLLDLSRVGRVANPSTIFSFTELCQEVVAMMQGLIDERQALVEIEENRFEVFADKARIREVVKNLVENGIKFARPDQTPRIRINASQKADKVLCRIEDNGPGIEPCYQDRVFGLFDRLETGVPGTGVGLALVKRIVEIHNGDIWIESQGDGQGSCFCFTLPFPEGN